jgi:hypothetical protein
MDGFSQHELQSVKRPDGTLGLYDYATNSTFKTTTVWVGQPGNTNALTSRFTAITMTSSGLGA